MGGLNCGIPRTRGIPPRTWAKLPEMTIWSKSVILIPAGKSATGCTFRAPHKVRVSVRMRRFHYLQVVAPDLDAQIELTRPAGSDLIVNVAVQVARDGHATITPRAVGNRH